MCFYEISKTWSASNSRSLSASCLLWSLLSGLWSLVYILYSIIGFYHNHLSIHLSSFLPSFLPSSYLPPPFLMVNVCGHSTTLFLFSFLSSLLSLPFFPPFFFLPSFFLSDGEHLWPLSQFSSLLIILPLQVSLLIRKQVSHIISSIIFMSQTPFSYFGHFLHS